MEESQSMVMSPVDEMDDEAESPDKDQNQVEYVAS